MAGMIKVPWIRWQRFRVRGVVRDEASGKPVAGLRVQAFDKDLLSDDFLGDTTTDAEGSFEIRFTDADFKDAVESQPDLYLTVFEPGRHEPIADTSYEIRENASSDEYYEIRVPARK